MQLLILSGEENFTIFKNRALELTDVEEKWREFGTADARRFTQLMKRGIEPHQLSSAFIYGKKRTHYEVLSQWTRPDLSGMKEVNTAGTGQPT